MRILELCTSPDYGGLELYVARASNALAAAGDVVVAVVGPQSRLTERFQSDGIVHRVVAVRCAPLPLLAAKALADIIDTQEVDAIHMHWGRDLPLAALAKRLSERRPALAYTRHMQITRDKKDAYHRWMYRQVDLLLTITETMATNLRRRLPPDAATRVRTLYHGAPRVDVSLDADLRRELRGRWGVPEDGVLVGLFSRLEEPKGQHLLVDAVGRARDEGLPLHALVVGRTMDGDYAGRLGEVVRERGLGQRIHFEGFTEQVRQWMQACDVVALTTREETFGLVLIEAMQAGIAVIGSDRGGVPEIIRHEENGLLFRSFDSVDFYTQLRRLAVDPALRRGLASRGRQDAIQRFDEQTHFSKLRELLHGVV